MYHMHIPPWYSMMIPIFERKWLIDKFIEQKKKENEAIEREKRKAKARAPRR